MANSDKVKWVREENASGTFSVSISPFHTDYTINCVILTKKSGVPTTIKAGFSLGADDLIWETDISFFPSDQGRTIALQVPPPSGKDTVYFVIPAGVFDIDILMIQRIGA